MPVVRVKNRQSARHVVDGGYSGVVADENANLAAAGALRIQIEEQAGVAEVDVAKGNVIGRLGRGLEPEADGVAVGGVNGQAGGGGIRCVIDNKILAAAAESQGVAAFARRKGGGADNRQVV